MIDADEIMNPQHFGSDPADIWVQIQINLGNPSSNPGSPSFEVRSLGGGLRSVSTVYSVSQKFLSPLRFSEKFSGQLRIFKQNFTCLLYVHIYSKWQNFIQLSLDLTKLCHIKCNHRVNFHCSLYLLHRKGWNWMATKFTRTQPTWFSCVGCNASGISQTSLKSQDHCRANSAQQQIWDDLSQTTINKAINDFRKRLNAWASASAGRGHFEQMIWNLYRNILTELCLLFQKR